MSGGSASALAPITWRPIVETDFPLLSDWLSRPHVHRYWHHDFTPEGVARDFGPGTRGEEAGEDLLVSLAGQQVALVQRSRIEDYAEDIQAFSAIVEVPARAVTIDYFVADPAQTGRGLGTAIIRAVVADTWSSYPECPAIIVPVVAFRCTSSRVSIDRVPRSRVGLPRSR